MTTLEALQVLGLKLPASSSQIKDAYKDLSQVWHPDRHMGSPRVRKRAEDMMRQINEAYSLLGHGRESHYATYQPQPQHPQQHQWDVNEKQSSRSSTVWLTKPYTFKDVFVASVSVVVVISLGALLEQRQSVVPSQITPLVVRSDVGPLPKADGIGRDPGPRSGADSESTRKQYEEDLRVQKERDPNKAGVLVTVEANNAGFRYQDADLEEMMHFFRSQEHEFPYYAKLPVGELRDALRAYRHYFDPADIREHDSFIHAYLSVMLHISDAGIDIDNVFHSLGVDTRSRQLLWCSDGYHYQHRICPQWQPSTKAY